MHGDFFHRHSFDLKEDKGCALLFTEGLKATCEQGALPRDFSLALGRTGVDGLGHLIAKVDGVSLHRAPAVARDVERHTTKPGLGLKHIGATHFSVRNEKDILHGILNIRGWHAEMPQQARKTRCIRTRKRAQRGGRITRDSERCPLRGSFLNNSLAHEPSRTSKASEAVGKKSDVMCSKRSIPASRKKMRERTGARPTPTVR